MRTLFSLLVAVSLPLAGCNDDDDDIGPISGEVPAAIFEATLSRLDAVPRCAAESPLSMGTALVTLSLDEQTVTLEHLAFAYLSSPATAAHIHTGSPGVDGPVVYVLADAPSSPLVGLSFPATADFVATLIAGGAYIDVHTRDCPSGEIRGQLGVAILDDF